MKKPLLLIPVIILLAITSCKNKKQDETWSAVVAGRVVSDSSLAEVKLYSYLNKFAGDSKTIPDKNGNFIFTLQLPAEFEFHFWYKRISCYLLIGPGDSIFINLNPTGNPQISFTGDNSSFLNEMLTLTNLLDLITTDHQDQVRMFQEFTPPEYLQFRRDLFGNNIDNLNKAVDNLHISDNLGLHYKSKLRVEYGADLLYFLNISSTYQGVKYMENLSEDYIFTLDSLFIAAQNDLWSIDYLNFLVKLSNLKVMHTGDTYLNAIRGRDKLLSTRIHMDNDLNNFDEFQKDYLISSHLLTLIDNGNINPETFDKYYNTVSLDYFKSALQKKYTEYKLIQKAQVDTSKIHLLDLSSSDTTSIFNTLRNLHLGKTLYIDIWATWCGSCISKFAYMPELKDALSEHNIEYIYLAISSKKDLWEKVIKQHKLEGYHYLLNSKQKKELYDKIPVSGIPHYFIIDHTGEIQIPKARSPYDKKLLKQIEALALDNN